MIICGMVQNLARPRTFDPETTLRRIYARFRTGGFSGTSLDELSDATRLARPSLYAAFGDKRAMYLKSLKLVAEDIELNADRLEALNLPLRAMLERWFAGSLAVYTAGEDGPGGCLAIGTASAEALVDSDIRAGLDRVLRVIDQRVERWLERAGESDVTGKARLVAALMHSLSLRARAGQPAAELDALWRQSLGAIVDDAKNIDAASEQTIDPALAINWDPTDNE